MNPIKTIACSALVSSTALFATLSAAAETADQPLTRAQVRQSAIDARKAGQLHVGDDPYYPYGRDAAVLKPARSKVKKAKATTASAQDVTASK